MKVPYANTITSFENSASIRLLQRVRSEADGPRIASIDRWPRGAPMCRSIKTLFNFDPPATELEIRDAALQFVRKLSGFAVPSKANEQAFEHAVAAIATEARTLVASLVTTAEPRNREVEAARAKVRSAARFGARP